MIEQDTAEIAKIRADLASDRRRDAYFWLIFLVTVILAAGSSILVSHILIRQSEHKLCAIVINADDGYRQSPPVTNAGKTQAANMSRLRERLGCPPYKEK